MRNKFVHSLAEDCSSMLAALKENSQIFGSHLEKAIKKWKKNCRGPFAEHTSCLFGSAR